MIRAYEQVKRNAKMSKEDLKNYMVKARADDAIPVTGVFENKETPGGKAEFSYKKWPGEEHLLFELWDGQRYTLPKGVVKHLVQNCAYAEFDYLSHQSGVAGIRAGLSDGRTPVKEQHRIKRMVHRYSFRPTEYVEGMFEDDWGASKLHVVEAMLPADVPAPIATFQEIKSSKQPRSTASPA